MHPRYDIAVEYEGINYTNNETAFIAQKCASMLDRFQFACMTPTKAKRTVAKLEKRPDWDAVRYAVMYDICKAKFTQNIAIGDKLADLDGHIEYSPSKHDEYWGIHNGKGANKLGIILMQIRDELANGDYL